MTAPVRVVLATNVVLSALVFGGASTGQVRRTWHQGALLPLASTATVQELVRVLSDPKFRLSQAEQGELLADYLPYTETVRIPQSPPPVPKCRDVLEEPLCTWQWRARRKCWCLATAICWPSPQSLNGSVVARS